MKAIMMRCKTAGFQYGDTAEVGTGKDKISAEAAKELVEQGLAEEVRVLVIEKK